MQAVVATLDPISPHAPAGRDARLEPEHELVRSEVEKITSVSGAAPDWALVESVGLELLRAKSKDLLIGCYVAYALVEQHGVDGANLGLGLLAELMARFGGELHPARARARVNALQWFLDRIGAWFEGAVNASPAQAGAMHQQAAALRVSAANLLGDEVPSFAALLRGVERLEIGARNTPSDVAASRQPPLSVAQPIASQRSTDAQPVSAAVVQTVSVDAPPVPPEDSLTDALIERWLEPVGASGVGDDTSYDDQYILVRQELEKLQGLAGETPDWLLVHDQASEILQTKSKDLVVAVQLTVALLETQGLAGLAEGFVLCTALIERYWQAMWPPLQRVKKRVGALQWLIDYCAVRLATWPVAAPSVDRDLSRLTEALVACCAGALGPLVPDFMPLRAAVRRLASEAPMPQAASRQDAPSERADTSSPWSSPSSSPSPTTARAVAAVHPIVEPSTDASASRQTAAEVAHAARVAEPSVSIPEQRAAMQEAGFVFGAVPEQPAQLHAYVIRVGALLVELGRARFAADKADARAYRWLRGGLFLRWEAAPAANRRGRIENDGPSSAKRAELLKTVKEEAWEAALVLSESLLARNPFWLDLQRISALALQNLGAGFALAQAQVEREARSLVARLPALLELQFADGSPLGSPDTLAWLKSAPEAVRAEGESAPIVPLGMLSAVLRGEPAQLAAFEASLRGCTSQREAFQLRLELAGMLCEANRLEQAKQLYLGLEHELDRYNLDAWEPELACRVLRPLWRLLAAEQSKGIAHPEGARICARLARLSPTSLL